MLRNRVRVLAIALLTFPFFFSGNGSHAQTSTRTVKIDSGRVEGAVSGNVLSFKWIPYAAPPGGNLRWRSPQPVKPWSGVQKAIQYGNDCIQKPLPGDAAASGGKTSEDCLVLNVWRPATLPPAQKQPVLVERDFKAEKVMLFGSMRSPEYIHDRSMWIWQYGG